ncbi:MAG TPA: NERD domain-containing protein [Candidatus Brocadiaceae bacterium]
MNQNVNDAEEFVYQVCRRSFLSLWSYPNPRGKDANKELCDILILCDPDVIIISVKEIGFTNSGNISTDWKRWRKRAIEGSIKQIYGAGRWIQSASHVIRGDGTQGLPFPEIKRRRIHRVAVALGGDGKISIRSGNFGKGFVHVFDRTSFSIILKELDTIMDFVQYLIAKENIYRPGIKAVFQGGEENLLALYLHNGCVFPKNYDRLGIDDTLWEGFKNKEEYKAKKLADEESYVWDRLLELISDDVLHGKLEFGSALSEDESTIRVMARENRFGRRVLGKAFNEFIGLSSQRKIRSRMTFSPSGITYVFLAMPHGEDRKFRHAELSGRCFVARGLFKDHKTVVGIATEQYEPGKGASFDFLCLHKENWADKDQQQLEFVQKKCGYFSNPQQQSGHEDEYPIN